MAGLRGSLQALPFIFRRTSSQPALFSAYATHLHTKGVPQRHRALVDVLLDKGVDVQLGNFKEKSRWCPNCSTKTAGHEEKETDVNIAIALMEAFLKDECDTAVIVTGDTDLVTAVRSAKRIFNSKRVGILFPYGRQNNSFKGVADISVRINPARYEQYQLPDPYVCKNGSAINKPTTW